MRMPQSLRFFRPRWMQLSCARLCHTLHNCNTKRPSWFFGCFGCLCKRPWENDVSHGLCCTREQRMHRIPDYKTQREKTAFSSVRSRCYWNEITQACCPFPTHYWNFSALARVLGSSSGRHRCHGSESSVCFLTETPPSSFFMLYLSF